MFLLSRGCVHSFSLRSTKNEAKWLIWSFYFQSHISVHLYVTVVFTECCLCVSSKKTDDAHLGHSRHELFSETWQKDEKNWIWANSCSSWVTHHQKETEGDCSSQFVLPHYPISFCCVLTCLSQPCVTHFFLLSFSFLFPSPLDCIFFVCLIWLAIFFANA